MDLDGVEGIRHIILYDLYDGTETPPQGDLELGISKTNKIYFKESKNTIFIPETATLKLMNYVGQIYIPSITSISLGDTYRDVTGIIESPSKITGHGNLNIVIERNKGLELCLISAKTIRLNEQIVHYEEGLLEKEQSVRLGADFDFLKFEYIEYINQNTPAHIIDEKKTYKRADFNNAKLKVEDIDVCMHHNLVLITKADGACNIDYIAPSIDTEEEFDLHVKRVEYNRLYRESKFAQYQGEYEKVKLLQKKMKPIEYKMKRLDKIIHTQTLHPIIQSSEVNKKAEPKNQNSVSNESNSTNTEPSQQSL